MTDAQIALKFSDDYPYEIDENANPGADLKPAGWAHRAARGVLADLTDRRGVKWELRRVDMDTRKDIVAALAEIIRLAHSEANAKVVARRSKARIQGECAIGVATHDLFAKQFSLRPVMRKTTGGLRPTSLANAPARCAANPSSGPEHPATTQANAGARRAATRSNGHRNPPSSPVRYFQNQRFIHANVKRMRPLPAWAEGYYRVGVHTTIKRRKHSGW